jgi:glycosyltransferase involved in cell wall biosynthesis
MRILFVAMAESVHTARWISQLDGQGWDIHLFPSIDWGMTHPDLKNVTIYHSFYGKQNSANKTLKFRGIPVYSELIASIGRRLLKKIFANYRIWQLKHLIKRLQPDLIHSIEIQAAGYLALDARKEYREQFPPWIVTNYGSDIYLFGRLAEHADRIRGVLAACDYYSCECQRDVQLAKQMGFRGEVLPVLPNTGGFDLTRVAQLKQPGPTSARRLILLKGYQGWAGRALVGLRAIALCANELGGYRIAIYLATPEVKIAAELLSQSTGLPIDLIPLCPHDEMLQWYGRARIYIGLSISDAISTSLLEAIVMGAFPIQSCTSCADEWILDGETGFIVPSEDPEPVVAAIRRALSDDALVDRASELNTRLARERLDELVIRPQVIAMYEKIATQARTRGRREEIYRL